jgi:hypothetical protein
MLHTFRNSETMSVLITLTYPREFPQDGRTVKRHWAAFRHWLTRRRVRGEWFLEFQKRGAPHFHVFVDRFVDYQEVAAAWYRIAGGGDRLHLAAGTRVEQLREVYAAARYAEKYAVKAEQKEVPEGFEEVGRFWGTFGGLKVEEVTSAEGTMAEMAPVVRVARNAYNARRRSVGLRAKRDKGRYSFTAFEVGPCVALYMDLTGAATLPLLC